MLEIRDLECVRGDHCLFTGLSFSLQAGELLYLRGSNGSGKTSLLRTLCGLLEPAEGEVLWLFAETARDFVELVDRQESQQPLQVVARFGAKDGVRCNTVAAGLIASEMAAAGLAAASVRKAADGIVLGRQGTPEEVARAVVFLASDASSYVTAQTLNVNGGLYF